MFVRRIRVRRLSVVLLAGALLAAVGCTSSSSSSSSASASSSSPASPPGSTSSGSRPNFVFVLTDDLAWNLVSHMPHVLGLEKAGTTMSKYYVVDSLCCPSRSAIFTGEYPHDDGVFTNSGSDGGYATFNAHGDQQKTWAVALHAAGYRTAMMGKYLNGYQPRDPIPPGWDEWDVAGNGYPEFNYNLNENGKVQHYGAQPQDYMVDVLSAKAGAFIDSAAARASRSCSRWPRSRRTRRTLRRPATRTPPRRCLTPSPRPTTGCRLTPRRGCGTTRRFPSRSRPRSLRTTASGSRPTWPSTT